MLKRFTLGLMLTAGLLLLAPAPEAEASWGWKKRSQKRHWVRKWRQRYWRNRHAVPELDPSAAGSAMVLVIGGIAYVVSRRREEDELA